jgi:hypothetical protein
MRVSRCINNNKVRAVDAGGLNAINQLTFVIALKRGAIGAKLSGQLLQTRVDIGQSLPAINFRLACTEQVQVRTVQNQYMFRHYEFL